MVFGQEVPPKWIIELPPGRYTVQELKERTGLTSSGITYTLKKYGARIEKECCYTNLVRNIFIWSGIKKGD